MNTLVIAECGINHNGSVTVAHQMVDVAYKCGVNVIKFQVHIPESEMISDLKYKVNIGHDLFETIKQCTLSFDELSALKNHCDNLGIEFLATPFSMEAVDFLETINVKRYKIGSGETNDNMILEKICATGKEILLSTGMSTFDEIYNTIVMLRHRGTSFVLFQCTSSYPCDINNIHLNSMKHLKEYFRCPVGLSDHSESIYPSIAAVAMGAVAIEKHFTLDKTMPGPDQASSLNPKEFTELVKAIECVESSMGSYEKRTCVSENVRQLFQHGVTTTRQIKAGEIISIDMITSKRPLVGIPTSSYMKIIGKKVSRDILPDTQLKWDDIII